ncbi:hybrid sensor histidine kinase/response regulator [Pelagivirga sediminicola]|uniref:histidine kinase n=1 Tax=Pelagivirga sediminicola TaxID=2170575 RepID=A0A2T7GAK3_9RHOB|nr:ATP-binding protein [Pelagivirga sediminicola]PVA11452.1 hybrid sensor histidine kinase/response regulator [Pelagivirga sediminicola]
MRPHAGLVLGSAILFAISAFLIRPGLEQQVMALVALMLGFSAGWIFLLSWVEDRAGARAEGSVRTLIEHDAAPSVLTGPDGGIVYCNDAAERTYKARRCPTLAAALQPLIANPGALLYRLQTRAGARGSAHEDVVTGSGHVRLSVHKSGTDAMLWRIEKSADMAARRSDAVPLPMLTVGRNNAILFMNDAARLLIGERARTLDRICPALPLRTGQMNDISTQTGPQPCLVVELEGIAGRREVFLLPGLAEHAPTKTGWTFFDDLPVPLLKLTRDGTIQQSNQPANDLLGCDASTGRQITDLLEGLGRSIPDWLEDAALARGALHSEFLRVRRSDREVFIQVTLNRAFEDGEPVLIAVLNDATQLKSLEAQFVQSQKMQAIGQLAGGVAHDFNNLLTAISGHCDLLLLRHDQGDSDYGDLLQIHQNANRAASLVNQLLAYSRKQTLRPEVMDLRDAMSDLTHLLNRLVGEKVVLSLNHDPTLSSIRADKRQFEQVVMNLVVNARDAMPDGGEIRIETRNITLDAPMHRDRAEVSAGPWVRISVTDEGTGIPADRLQKVFEPFFTTKRTGEGTGLGLSTAYGIVKQTGGFIFADSEEGVGTTFFLMFPAHETVAPRAGAKPAAQIEAASAEGLVLLVEDEAPVRAFASRALQMRGFTVLEAESAEEALEILQDETICVDVFVTDVVMPGMDGPSWVQEAMKTRPDTRVVFVSGYAEEDFGDTQARIPNSVFLPKPFSLTELTDIVQRQMQ